VRHYLLTGARAPASTRQALFVQRAADVGRHDGAGARACLIQRNLLLQNALKLQNAP